MTAPPDAPGNRVAVLTFSGGAGIVSADFIEENGLRLADLSEETRTALRGLYPAWMPVAHPIDLWPALESHIGQNVNIFGLALKAVLADPGVDAVFLHAFTGNAHIRIDPTDLVRPVRESGKPAVVWQTGRREESFSFQQQALRCGIPVFTEIGRAVECLAAVLRGRYRPETIPALGIPVGPL